MTPSKPTPLSFVICSEGGILEHKSLVFVHSLRKFGGALRHAPVLSLSPRRDRHISPATAAAFRALGVDHRAIDLNRDHAHDPFANKIYAGAYAEQHLDSDILVFTDSDQIILNPPHDLLLPDQTDAAVQVVARKGIGTNGRDASASYWRELYQLLGCVSRAPVRLANGEEILEYYNAGLVAVRRSKGLFGQCLKNLRLVSRSELSVPDPFFLEQSLLSATFTQQRAVIKQLSVAYNYPIFRPSDLESLGATLSFDEICSLHYHRTFDPPRSIPWSAVPISLKGPQLSWLETALIQHGLNPQPFVSTPPQSSGFDLKARQLIQLALKKREGDDR